jgi:CRP-like cAMP-binding protein
MRLVQRSVFLELLGREPMAVEGLLRALPEETSYANVRHADFAGLDVRGRLAKWLLNHAGVGGGGNDGRAALQSRRTGLRVGRHPLAVEPGAV